MRALFMGCHRHHLLHLYKAGFAPVWADYAHVGHVALPIDSTNCHTPAEL